MDGQHLPPLATDYIGRLLALSRPLSSLPPPSPREATVGNTLTLIHMRCCELRRHIHSPLLAGQVVCRQEKSLNESR